jgi:uncharacterized protein YdhG (YjbR/CyaY superfamily)
MATNNDSFSKEERAAIKERARELKAQAKNADAEKDLLEKIAALEQPDRGKAERIHELVKEHAPSLTFKSWYGMPGYARDGKVLVFFQAAAKFGTRYPTLGFNDNASLDDGNLWPVAFAIDTLGAAEEKTIAALLKKAAG